MKQVKIISSLDINAGKVTTILGDEYIPIFLKQGDVDGACGPYCVFMALLISGEISREDIDDLWNIKLSTRLGKLVKGMRDHDTLFRSGTHITELNTLLNNSFGKVIKTDENLNSGKSLIPFIIEGLQKDAPIVVGVKNRDMGHWLLAVGYEEVNDKISKIFFLDPSGVNTSNYWNAAIDIIDPQSGIYPYAWIDHNEDTNEFIQLDEALLIQKL
ncbi:hypothetical protein MED134_07044 [Dokdonia sp. MED134]|uniref:hypothetical protein n=1 Tax=Dokdonia sp. MED134 TaxID=313590 RepID=UPI000068AB1F|nr:hypothetical protein [Dokdonia sp. MED134]EAQ40492.1 hypothetical protein MED134_07044 [Dokdonia sp. MED134]